MRVTVPSGPRGICRSTSTWCRASGGRSPPGCPYGRESSIGGGSSSPVSMDGPAVSTAPSARAPTSPVGVLEGGADVHHRRGRGAGQHRVCQVTPFGVRASFLVRGALPAVGPLPVAGLVQLSGVGGVLDGSAIVLHGTGAQSGGFGLPAVVLEPDPQRLVVVLVAPPLGGFRRCGPLRRVRVVGLGLTHRRGTERGHVDGDRRPSPGRMVGRSHRCGRLPGRDTRRHGEPTHRRWGGGDRQWPVGGGRDAKGDRCRRAGGDRRCGGAGRRRPGGRSGGGGMRRAAGVGRRHTGWRPARCSSRGDRQRARTPTKASDQHPPQTDSDQPPPRWPDRQPMPTRPERHPTPTRPDRRRPADVAGLVVTAESTGSAVTGCGTAALSPNDPPASEARTERSTTSTSDTAATGIGDDVCTSGATGDASPAPRDWSTTGDVVAANWFGGVVATPSVACAGMPAVVTRPARSHTTGSPRRRSPHRGRGRGHRCGRAPRSPATGSTVGEGGARERCSGEGVGLRVEPGA